MEILRNHEVASWKRGLDAEEPDRNVHTFSTPPLLEILKLLPVAYRVGTYIHHERSNGREPIFDMSGIKLQPPNPGPYAGVPLGGIGSGSIGRGFRGDFRRWSLNPGRYSHQQVHADSFCVRVRHKDVVTAKVLSFIRPDSTSCLNSWKFNMVPKGQTYFARFPFAWTVYENAISGIKITVRQLSPFLPENYSESCLPASVLDVIVENQSNDAIEVSVMFVFQNGMNVENSKRALSKFRHETFEVSSTPVLSATSEAETNLFESISQKNAQQHIRGIQMLHSCRFESGNSQSGTETAHASSSAEESSFVPKFCSTQSAEKSDSHRPRVFTDQNSFAIACSTDTTNASTVTFCPKFQSVHACAVQTAATSFCSTSTQKELFAMEEENAEQLWQTFEQYGRIESFPDVANEGMHEDGARYSGALCIQRKIPGKASSTFRFALAWDYPIARFGSGIGLPRYYTRFFGKTGEKAAQIASYALQHVDEWETAILHWQADVLAKLDEDQCHLLNTEDQRENLEFYRSQIFNELYFLVDGGTIWTDSKSGISNQGTNSASNVVISQPPSDPGLFSSVTTQDLGSPLTPEQDSGGNIRIFSSLLRKSAVSESASSSELQKSLLDHSPNTVTTEDMTPMTTDSNSMQAISLLWEDLARINRQMEINNEEVRECGGNQSIVGQFLYLEGHEYLMYNTYDVHFYASFALLMLWPELELSLQRDIADSVGKENKTIRTMMGEGHSCPRKSKVILTFLCPSLYLNLQRVILLLLLFYFQNVVPHDVGSPSETPWLLPNVYNFQDVSSWKDLGTKFVLQIYRDYHFLQKRYAHRPENIVKFLRDIYPVLCTVMHHEESFDLDKDGMIENSGFPDQTYDIWTATGVHAYCGGLWISACEAMVKSAALLQDDLNGAHYAQLARRAREVYIRVLWNEKDRYFHYDNSQSTHCDSIMSDMLAGQWYARACDLPNLAPKEHLLGALRTIFNWNVKAFAGPEGQWRGAVNGTRPVRDPLSKHIVSMEIDNTCLQSREVWTGTTYALAATMLQEALCDNLASPHQQPNDDGDGPYSAKERQDLLAMAFATARGIHDAGWQRYGYWFATPEGWEQNGNYRSLGYMRALAIWAMQFAMHK